MLAIVHSVMLWLTYELALSVCPWDDPRQRLMFGLCGVAFALINPILLQQIGSTFADITTGELVLAGWLLLALAVRTPSIARVICAGLLCGIATGLKLTNALHAICGFAVLILLPLTLWGRIRHGLAYGISLGLGFGRRRTLVLSPRAEIRQSPVSLDEQRIPVTGIHDRAGTRFAFHSGNGCRGSLAPVRHDRSCNDGARRTRAPDPRYALLLIVVGAFFCRWLWRRRAAS